MYGTDTVISPTLSNIHCTDADFVDTTFVSHFLFIYFLMVMMLIIK